MIALDIETALDDRGFYTRELTVASTAEVTSDRLKQYSPATIYDLVDQLPFQDLIIGFNIDTFDLPVLSQYASRPLAETCRTLDLYHDLAQLTGQTDIKFDDLARGTLGKVLPQHGGNLANLGQTRKLFQHSANGVLELNAIYRFGAVNRYVTWIAPSGEYHETPVNWNL